jgi:hypothetical protein
MDNEMQQLLKELEELVKEPEANAPPQQSINTQPNSSPQANTSGVEEQFRAWKELGLIRFGSQFGHLKNFSKILNLVIPKADQKVLTDIQSGRVRDEYFDYLEEAYNEVLKEIASFSKDILSSQYQFAKQQMPTSQQPPTLNFKMNDYANEYKKYLEKITAKEAAIVEFLDGIEDGGKMRRIGIPKASIRENVSLDETN